MPFIAMDSEGNRKFSLTLAPPQYRQPWVCPECHQEMVFVDINTRRKHFRHVVESDCLWEPETEEHMEMKDTVFGILTQRGFRCQFEVRIGKRIADIQAVKGKDVLAIECQVSPLKVIDILDKNKDYQQAGARPLWILHPLNYLKEYSSDTCRCYRLKEVERTFMNLYWFLYYAPEESAIYQIDFKPKFAGGGGSCTTLHFIRCRFLRGRLYSEPR